MHALPLLLILLAAVAFGQPHGFGERDQAHRPGASVVTASGPGGPTVVYTQSYELAGCANEDGVPAAGNIQVAGGPFCESTGGVTDGAQALFIDNTERVEMESAFAATSEPYFEIDFTPWDIVNSVAATVLGTVTGAASSFPRAGANMNSGVNETFRVECAGGASQDGTFTMIEGTTYRLQLDAKAGNGQQVTLRVYEGSTLRDTVQCTNAAGVSDFDGVFTGRLSGDPAPTGGDYIVDRLLVSTTPFGAP